MSIIDYIFRVLLFSNCSKELKLPGLIAETQTANQASCRLLEKVGKKRVKTLSRFGAEQVIYCLFMGGINSGNSIGPGKGYRSVN